MTRERDIKKIEKKQQMKVISGVAYRGLHCRKTLWEIRVLKNIRIEFGSPKLEKLQKNRFRKFENSKIYHNLFSKNCLFSKKIAKHLVFLFKFKQNLRKVMSKYF